jgi:hypothetical protein
MLPAEGGKRLSRKALHNWIEKSFEGWAKVADDPRPSAVGKWLSQKSKDFYALGFDAFVKRWDKYVTFLTLFRSYKNS